MKKLSCAKGILAGLLITGAFYSCKKDHNAPQLFNVTQTNLVADTAGYNAARIDTNLKNAWGMAVNPSGPIWISTNHTGLSVVYDSTGKQLRAPVIIPPAAAGQPGTPSGQVFNNTPDFGGSKFIFASEDGVITDWSAGNNAAIAADRSGSGAVYKGLAIANDGTANFLYVANFKGRTVDVFDKNFAYVTNKPFADPNLPPGYGPFNIQNIGGSLYVTYAKLLGPDNEDDEAGPGNGYVDIFTPQGMLVKRFASQGTLNSPWGIAWAPAGFAAIDPTILVGNFGDGRINVFNQSGKYLGQLSNNGQPVTINGLWAIDFLKSNQAGGSPNDPLYFTAGPNGESHGLFGYLKKQ
ncbi:MAG: TIGR03118 family protein [Bacteroidetes bacterium]|nr:TIGR03118 family protein [Bacteroidota bacterium]